MQRGIKSFTVRMDGQGCTMTEEILKPKVPKLCHNEDAEDDDDDDIRNMEWRLNLLKADCLPREWLKAKNKWIVDRREAKISVPVSESIRKKFALPKIPSHKLEFQDTFEPNVKANEGLPKNETKTAIEHTSQSENTLEPEDLPKVPSYEIEFHDSFKEYLKLNESRFFYNKERLVKERNNGCP